jgi:hypothetical protein
VSQQQRRQQQQQHSAGPYRRAQAASSTNDVRLHGNSTARFHVTKRRFKVLETLSALPIAG